jgi:signal transduction histidine kinase
MISDLIQSCQWDTSHWLIFSQNVVSPLIYYSHLTPIFVSILFGLYIYRSNKTSLLNKTLFTITGILSLWLFLDLILWASNSITAIIFAWSVVNMIEPIIYAGFVYFIYLFVVGDDISRKVKLLLVIPLLPSVFLASTHWNILGFNLTNCDRTAIEGPVAFYNYVIEIGYVLWIVGIGVWASGKNRAHGTRRQQQAVIAATLLLLLGFASGNIVGSFSQNWALGQVGLFMVPVLIGVLAYFIIQFRFIAQSQLALAQLLVISLWLAVGSILFLQNLQYVRILIVVTLIFLTALGYLLLKSLKIESEQRQDIEQLAVNLESANRRQITLIHFITHQIKGFVSKSRNIFSLALDGDFGEISPELRPILENGLQSDTKGVATIQEILNAATIKTGTVTYEHEPVNLAALVRNAIADQLPEAERKGLPITFDCQYENATFTGDALHTAGAIKNVLDNSIKYTLSGRVAIVLKKKAHTLLLTIQDTGIGITTGDMRHLFTEGGHGKNSIKTNVESTGFGLFIAKNIIEAQGGSIHAESAGEGMGSRFTIEFPL